jgi:hypothetical protein
MELGDVEGYVAGSPFAPPEQLWVMHASAEELEHGINLPSAWRHSVFPGNVFRIRKDASRIAPSAAASGPRAAKTADDAGGGPPPRADEDLRALHARTTREWTAEIQRLSAELDAARATAVDAKRTVAAMERSAFWRARLMWVRLAALFGSDRGGVPHKSRT